MTDPDRLQKPSSPGTKRLSEEGGPKAPTVKKPGGGNELLKRMKQVDPDQAKKYRQRSGQ